MCVLSGLVEPTTPTPSVTVRLRERESAMASLGCFFESACTRRTAAPSSALAELN